MHTVVCCCCLCCVFVAPIFWRASIDRYARGSSLLPLHLIWHKLMYYVVIFSLIVFAIGTRVSPERRRRRCGGRHPHPSAAGGDGHQMARRLRRALQVPGAAREILQRYAGGGRNRWKSGRVKEIFDSKFAVASNECLYCTKYFILYTRYRYWSQLGRQKKKCILKGWNDVVWM